MITSLFYAFVALLLLAVSAWSWTMLYLYLNKKKVEKKQLWLSFIWILGSIIALVGIPLLLHLLFHL